MKLVVQNVSHASVNINNQEYSSIKRGFLVLVGFTQGDDINIINKMADKLLAIRVFNDANGKTNLSINDIDGEILVVSQFTLYANFKEGRRPSFVDALPGHMSEPLYQEFIKNLNSKFKKGVKTGVFGADMQVTLVNDGPFTSLLDSKDIVK
ncbi:MAG: D-aminoacyl-tRNA deacylase [Bacilli bacterium]|nr:D-aminoacyl-tRNA deacylase [Bacilli bacterium]